MVAAAFPLLAELACDARDGLVERCARVGAGGVGDDRGTASDEGAGLDGVEPVVLLEDELGGVDARLEADQLAEPVLGAAADGVGDRAVTGGDVDQHAPSWLAWSLTAITDCALVRPFRGPRGDGPRCPGPPGPN